MGDPLSNDWKQSVQTLELYDDPDQQAHRSTRCSLGLGRLA